MKCSVISVNRRRMGKDAPLAGIMYDKSLDPDIRSLRQIRIFINPFLVFFAYSRKKSNL